VEWVPWKELLSLPMRKGDYLFTPLLYERGYFSVTLVYANDAATLRDKKLFSRREELIGFLRQKYGPISPS
jgi:hypothetical protein